MECNFDRQINWTTTFFKIKNIKEVKLKWFQIRIVHRIIGTNKTLKWMNMVDDDLCTFCREETEDIEHLFWGCDVIQQFWLRFMMHLNRECNDIEDIVFNEELVILGHTRGFKSDDVFDFILTYGKFYIYSCKFNNNMPEVSVFIKQLYHRFRTEEYIARTNMNEQKLTSGWMSYMPLFRNM